MHRSEQQSSVKTRLDEIENSGLTLSAKSLDSLTDLAKAVESLEQKLIKELSASWRMNDDEKVNSLAVIGSSLSAILSQIEAIPEFNTPEECILRRLYFSSMHSRLDTVSEAEMGTFAWLLEDEAEELHLVKSGPTKFTTNTNNSSPKSQNEPNEQGTDPKIDEEYEEDENSAGANHPTNKPSIKYSDEQRLKEEARRSFLEWLRSGDGIYHISGKAGSGKSTLVKFLCQNPRLTNELEQWAGKQNLVFASFFFWASGDRLQRSLEGLYRSLLFEILSQCPELIETVFPEQLAKMRSNPTKWVGMPLLFSELRQAMETITTKCSFAHHRFFFLIDGLDEYEGDSTDHLALARSLQKWSFSADMKMCVSSRPHTEFLDVFDSNLQMHLHHLTRADIELFTMAMFEKESNFDNTNEGCREIVRDIVNSAEGVFLWVRLVIRSVLDGFRHRYPVAHLKQKLEKMPRELDLLFDRIFNSIDSGNREKSDKMLLLAAAYPNIDVLMFSWLDDLEDSDFPFNTPIEAYSDIEIRDRHDVVRLQLDGLCKGLLEIAGNLREIPTQVKDIYFDYQVQFFHRTVRDYVNEPARYAEIEGRLSDFDVEDAYRRLLLAEFRFARTTKHYFESQALGQTQLVSCFHDFFERVADQAPLRFWKEYDWILDHHRRQPFSFPGDTQENPGVIAWSQRLESQDCGGALSGDDISYLHWAASYDQREYIIEQLLSNPSLINTTDDGRSLLLTAAISPSNHDLVQDLLKCGASPRHQVPVTYQEGETFIASIWAVFLFIVARRSELRRNKDVEKMFPIMEELLKSGAESNVYFLFKPRSQGNLEKGPGHSQPDSEDGIRFITLEDLILKARPPNMDTLLGLILDTKQSELWNETLRALKTLVLWNGSSNDVQSRYKRARIEEIDSNYVLKGVDVSGESLEGEFNVKWF